MPTVSVELKPAIRYLIHLGLVEIRNLAFHGGHDTRIAKLADVLEFLPRLLAEDQEPDFAMVREQFEQYQTENSTPLYDYLAYLDGRLPIPQAY